MKSSHRILVSLLLFLVIGCALGYLLGTRGIPFVGRFTQWSIGQYEGQSPFQLSSHTTENPILTIDDVTDVRADFVADPFVLRTDDRWYLFFELLNGRTGHGDIAVASSLDLNTWNYEGLVLDEPFHLSFPHIFHAGDEILMVPETGEANQIRLYRAENFPNDWVFERELLSGYHVDPVVFRHDGLWWIYSCTSPNNDVLRLYYSDDLNGDWIEHPESPIVAHDPSMARPAGAVLFHDGVLYRFAQDDSHAYGRQVRAFRVLELTRDTYAEEETALPALQPSGRGWNSEGMHHVSFTRKEDGTWVAIVDGWTLARKFGLQF